MEQSAYITSKMGQLKFMELLAVETPDCHILTVHPGVVKTDIMQGFSVPGVSVDDGKYSVSDQRIVLVIPLANNLCSERDLTDL